MSERTEKFRVVVGALCDKYVKSPDDTEGLAVAEGMLNEIFARAGANPPERIKLWFGEAGVVEIGFESHMPASGPHADDST